MPKYQILKRLLFLGLGIAIALLGYSSVSAFVWPEDDPQDIAYPVGFGTEAGSLDERPVIDSSVPRFLTLPFSDTSVRMTQAWICHFGSDICGEYSPYGAHHAIDYAKFSSNRAVSFDLLAAAPGTATCYTQSTHPLLSWHYGNVIQIDHSGAGAGYSTIYAHVASCGFTSRSVQRGEHIGSAGTTGNSTGIHLHFELRTSAFSRVDPYDLWAKIDSYPQPGSDNPLAGSSHYWTTNPPSFPNLPDPPPSTDCLKPLLRYWHDEMTGHFYTSRWEELGPGKSGWAYEGFEGYVAAERDCFVPDTRPLYRFWHPDRRKHFYTTSEGEKEAVEGQGFIYDGVTGYVLPSEGELTLPLYRCYSTQEDDHFYTTNWDEVQNAVDNHGYAYEYVEGYIFAAEALESNSDPEIEISVYLPLVIR